MASTDKIQIAVERLINTETAAIDKLVKELILPMEPSKNPEEMIGKPFTQWSPEDWQRAVMVYGPAEDSPLSKMIAKRLVEALHAKEAEV